jgi:lipopolysaccharide/colanic/teichoic acid biosynthesis glycosyltransferase
VTLGKRLLDLTLAVPALIALSPGFAILALLVKLDSAGPVFFRQERIGRRGQPFRIWKFRSMHQGADRAGLLLTVGSDSRITRLGRWLRATKLDELPQLLNVVRGEMSFVGPRPEVPRYVEHYTAAQRRVLELTPGITDLASITYRHEAELLAEVDDPEDVYVHHILPDKIRLNLEYSERATVLSDLRLILQTLTLLPARHPPAATNPPRRA